MRLPKATKCRGASSTYSSQSVGTSTSSSDSSGRGQLPFVLAIIGEATVCGALS